MKIARSFQFSIFFLIQILAASVLAQGVQVQLEQVCQYGSEEVPGGFKGLCTVAPGSDQKSEKQFLFFATNSEGNKLYQLEYPAKSGGKAPESCTNLCEAVAFGESVKALPSKDKQSCKAAFSDSAAQCCDTHSTCVASAKTDITAQVACHVTAFAAGCRVAAPTGKS